MSVIIKSGSSGTFLTINPDGSINTVFSGAADVADRAARLLGHVQIDNFPATQAIAGSVSISNFPAVQPVSGSISVSNFPATQNVAGSISVSNFPSVQGVSGIVAVSNFPATQPVSGSVSVSNFPAVQTVSDLKDTGRTYVTLSADRVAGRLAEALELFDINRAGVVTTGVSSYTVPVGKKFRITSLEVEILNTGNTINRVMVRVRSDTTVLVTSPRIAMGMAVALTAVAVSGGQDGITFSEGIEIAAGQQVGISQLCTVNTAGVVSFLLQGYEY